MNTCTTTCAATSGQLALIDLLQTIHPLREEVFEHIIQNSTTKIIRRGKYLLKPGETCNHYYFIFKGIIRAYIKYGNKEVTTWINIESEVSTSIRSMVLQQKSLEYIQALEDCELIVMPYEALQFIYDNYPEMNTVGRILITKYYADAEERAFISRIPTAATRYEHFMNSRPDLLNRVPLKYIASFLGITVETLSRLRKNVTPRKARLHAVNL